MSQLTYDNTIPVGYPGLIYDLHKGYNDTLVSTEASAVIPFGCAVCKGSTDEGGILPVDANSKFEGVLIKDDSYAPGSIDLDANGLKPKASLSIRKRGPIWVKVEEAVVKNDPAFFRHTASGGNTQKGAWRKSADTATAVEAQGCYFMTSASAGGLAVLWVDIPVQRAAEKVTALI